MWLPYPSDDVPLGDRVPTRTSGKTKGHSWSARMASTTSVSRHALHRFLRHHNFILFPLPLLLLLVIYKEARSLLICVSSSVVFQRTCEGRQDVVVLSPILGSLLLMLWSCPPHELSCLLLYTRVRSLQACFKDSAWKLYRRKVCKWRTFIRPTTLL